MHDISYEWIKLVEKALLKVQQLPALEEHFPFPWERAGQALQDALNLSQFTLSCSKSAWKNPHEFLYGMGENPAIVALELAPLEGQLFLILPQADVTELTSNILVRDQEKENFFGPQLKQGFYHFLLLKIIDILDHLKIFKDISIHLLPSTPLPQESGFCIEIACTLSTRTLQARLLCPQAFLNAFKAHIPLQKVSLLSWAETRELDLKLKCEIGYVWVTSEQWDCLQVGDFLILDRCSYDPLEGKGSLTVSLETTTLFIARFKPEGLKVLDYAFYEEALDTPPPEEESTTADILLHAEIADLSISLSQLLQLKSGSLLDLPIKPEQGITLTTDGKQVAKAELLKLGQIVGLRILNIEK